MMIPLSFAKVLKFSITGTVGMAVDFGFTVFFKELLRLKPYVANCIGISAAIIVIFLLHKKWTFSNSNKNINKQFKQFVITSLLGLLLNTGLLFFFQHYLFFAFYSGKLLSIVLVGFWNFSINSLITFKPE